MNLYIMQYRIVQIHNREHHSTSRAVVCEGQLSVAQVNCMHSGMREQGFLAPPTRFHAALNYVINAQFYEKRFGHIVQ